MRFEYESVGISEGIFAVLFVVMDTKTVLINGVERRSGVLRRRQVKIRHQKFVEGATEVESTTDSA